MLGVGTCQECGRTYTVTNCVSTRTEYRLCVYCARRSSTGTPQSVSLTLNSHPLMTTRHKLLSSIVHEYVVKNDDLDGFVDDLLIYFPDMDEDLLADWANDLRN